MNVGRPRLNPTKTEMIRFLKSCSKPWQITTCIYQSPLGEMLTLEPNSYIGEAFKSERKALKGTEPIIVLWRDPVSGNQFSLREAFWVERLRAGIRARVKAYKLRKTENNHRPRNFPLPNDLE